MAHRLIWILFEITFPQAAGSGVFAVDGKMVDRPVVKGAEQILEKAKAARLIKEE